MKKLLLFLMAVLTLASCSKSDSPAPAPTPTSLIIGEWKLQSGVQRIMFPDGASEDRPLNASQKATFTEDGRLLDGLKEFNYHGSTPYAYNATTSKLIVGDGAIPRMFEVVVLTKSNLRLTYVSAPSTADRTFSVYSYNYVR